MPFVVGYVPFVHCCTRLLVPSALRIIHSLLEGTGSCPVGFAPTFSFGTRTTKMAMANESIAARVQELAERVAVDHGLELVHTEVAGPENKPKSKLSKLTCPRPRLRKRSNKPSPPRSPKPARVP